LKVTRREQLNRINALLVQQSNKMASVYLQAIQDIQDEVVLQDIVNLLERHNFNAVANIVNQHIEAKLIPFIQVTHDSFVAGGLFAAESIL
jgi:hypothetical protein